ncbi:MAG: hypothetical protein AB7O71_09695 [Hyphomicrobiaceae bacterium]
MSIREPKLDPEADIAPRPTSDASNAADDVWKRMNYAQVKNTLLFYLSSLPVCTTVIR